MFVSCIVHRNVRNVTHTFDTDIIFNKIIILCTIFVIIWYYQSETICFCRDRKMPASASAEETALLG